MQHGNKYRTVTLCIKTTEGNELGIPVTFLIGPVQQPILSMGRLEDDMRANLDIKNRHFECGRHRIQVDRIMRSYHLPVWVDRPEAADQVQMIQQVKRLEIEGDVVKFKFKSKQTELEGFRPTEPRRAEPILLDETKGLWRQNENVLEVVHVVVVRGQRRFRQRVGQWLRGQERKGEKPEFPSRPPPAAPTQSLDVQYFGHKSRRMKAILEKEDWAKAGPQYMGQDGVPITFKLYYGTRLQGPTKDSKKVDGAVCECGKVLKPNEGSLWSHLFAKHCVPEVMWKFWDVEYKVRKDESPEPSWDSKTGERQGTYACRQDIQACGNPQTRAWGTKAWATGSQGKARKGRKDEDRGPWRCGLRTFVWNQCRSWEKEHDSVTTAWHGKWKGRSWGRTGGWPSWPEAIRYDGRGKGPWQLPVTRSETKEKGRICQGQRLLAKR